MKINKIILITGIITILLFSGCTQDVTENSGVDNEDINDISLYEEDSEDQSELTLSRSVSRGRKKVEDFSYDITREARILPVLVDGEQVQANDILISGNNAFIAYNFAGEPFLGAIQIIDLGNKKDISIELEIRFPHRDINAVYVEDNIFYFGGQSDPDYYGSGKRAFIMALDLDNLDNISSEDDLEAVYLSSYGVTGITGNNGKLYVSVGAADGGIEVLDQDDLSAGSTFIEAADARDVASFYNGVLFITGQTDLPDTAPDRPARIQVLFNKSETPVPITLGDFDSDYHKVTIEVFQGRYALLGLSSEGFKMVDMFDLNSLSSDLTDPEEFKFVLPNPYVSNPDLKPYTNSVSSDGSLIFTANGNYGFRVLKKTGNELYESSIVGYLPFEDLGATETYSANHIDYKNNLLFVAAGLGGVLIYDFK